VAAVTHRWSVQTTSATRLPGDEPIELDDDDLSPVGPDQTIIGHRPGRRSVDGPPSIEVVVGGWRFELEVDDARRAELRRRASRDSQAGAADHSGEVRAIIPGRVVAVNVAVGDRVVVGQPLLVVEAMKMQNELRSPLAGEVRRLNVGAGQTIELGDVLVAIAGVGSR